MALRDYLNVPTREELRTFVLAPGQAIAVLGVNELGDIPQETWYFDDNSMEIDDDTTVIRPDDILETDPGRYILNMVQSDWDTMFNKPNFSTVALSGDYNDLTNKLTAGTGILINSNALSVNDSEFTSTSVSTAMQSSIDTKAPLARVITINGQSQDLSSNRSWQVGNVSTDQSYNNPSWITGLAGSKITGLATVANTGVYSDLTGKPTLSTVSSTGSYNDLINKPALATVATSGSYNDLTNKPSALSLTTTGTSGAATLSSGVLNIPNYLPTSSQITTALGFTPISQAGARTAISLTTTGTSGSATYSSSTGVLNIPNYSNITPAFNNNSGTRALNTSYQPSTTRATIVNYSILNTIALTLVTLSGSSQTYLEISPDNSTWTTVNQAGYSDGVAIAVSITKTLTTNLSTVVPAGWYFRLRSVVSGAGTAAVQNFQEVQI